MLQQRHTEDQVPTLLCSCEFVQQATIYLVQSYGHGMFTYSSLWLWLWMSSPKRKGLCRDIPDIAMELFEDEWDIFLEETGVQPLGTTCCAYCEREGVRHPDKKSDDKVRTLKQCAGDCMRDKKPLYCSQWCQAMVSGGNIFNLAALVLMIMLTRTGNSTGDGVRVPKIDHGFL